MSKVDKITLTAFFNATQEFIDSVEFQEACSLYEKRWGKKLTPPPRFSGYFNDLKQMLEQREEDEVVSYMFNPEKKT